MPHDDVDIIDRALIIFGESAHTYESDEEARRAGNAAARLISVGCKVSITDEGEVRATPTSAQRAELRERRTIRK